jgi:hypothetical protein
MHSWTKGAWVLALLIVSSAGTWGAERLVDKRVTEFRSKDTTYPIVQYSSQKVWLNRSDQIRKEILTANGLWPMPEKTPLNAKRSGRLDRDGYSIEEVYFESYPGFYCTGNLYLPRDRKPPYAAMLCPHGHWKEGRLADEKNGSVVARCITFARQGYVVFAPDMVGYNDSRQVRHRAGQFAAPLWGLSLMGLQTWNNIRGIDFLLTVEGVDPKRIGCTGASGGGTQTFILTAIDNRVKCAVPVCMVSDFFQGGCECENAPLLRLNTTNIEIAASAAPRPYMITGATGDWTKHIMTVQGPAIREIYKLFGAEDKFNYVIVDAPHNYNKESREHVYRWMGKWLLNETDAEKLHEPPYTLEKKEDVLVFTDAHPLPAGSLDEKGVRDMLIERTRKQFESLKPKDRKGMADFQAYRTALWHMFFSETRRPPTAKATLGSTEERPTWKVEEVILTGEGLEGQELGGAVPTLVFTPKKAVSGRSAVLVHPKGRAGVLDSQTGSPKPALATLLEAGYVVAVPNCFLTGEGEAATSRRALPKEFPYTYNPTTLAWRVWDIVLTAEYLRLQKARTGVALIGLEAASPWCLLASATMSKYATVVDANGFADADEASWQGDMFQPNILRCGGLRGAGALAAPARLLIHNTQGKLDTKWVADVYRAAGAPKAFRAVEDRLSDKEIVEWLVQR